MEDTTVLNTINSSEDSLPITVATENLDTTPDSNNEINPTHSKESNSEGVLETIEVKVLILYLVDFYIDSIEPELSYFEQRNSTEELTNSNLFIRVLDQIPLEVVDYIDNGRIRNFENPFDLTTEKYVDFLFYIAEDFASALSDEKDTYNQQLLRFTQEKYPDVKELELMRLEATLEVVLLPPEPLSKSDKLTRKIEAINLVSFNSVTRVSNNWTKAQ